MGIVIKRWIRYLMIAVGILIAIPLLLYITIQIPGVQTMVVRRITDKLSENLQADIFIRKVDYRFFNKLALSEVLFLDRNLDTLLYTEKLAVGIRRIDMKKRVIGLGRIDMTRPHFSLITDSTGKMNLRWYLDQLRSGNDSSKKELDLTIDRVDIINGLFSFKNNNSEKRNTKIKVNFADMVFDRINGTVEDFRVYSDTTSFKVYDLTFTEKSGFNVKRLTSGVTISGSDIFLESAIINCDTSVLNINKLAILADTATGFRNFIEDVRITLNLDKSLLSTSDLRYFAPLPEDLNESLTLSGRFTGTVSELRGRDVNIAYRERTFLDCDFDVSGLPEIDNAFIYLGFNEFTTNAIDLRKIVLPGGKRINLPEFMYKMDDISFDGSFSGFTTDFVTYGEFTSDFGEIKTDISLRPENNRYRMQGLMNGRNINLGELTGSEILGNLNIHANVNGYATSTKNFAGNITGLIDSVGINGYNYRNIELNGRFSEKTWDGSIKVDEENIRLDLLGMFDFNDTLPEFDFTMNLAKADLHSLNIDRKDSTSWLSVLLTSNFRGNSIDNLDGEIKLLNSDITRNGKTLELYDFSIRTFSENDRPVLNLRTDFVDATVRGNYNFEGLKHFVRMTASNLMPSLVGPEKESDDINHNDFSFEINFKNTNRINDFFNTGLVLAPKTYLRGSVAPDTMMSIEGKSDLLSYKNIKFSNLILTAGTSGRNLDANISTASVILPGETDLANFNINIQTVPDTFYVRSEWDNRETVLSKGLITARGTVNNSAGGWQNPALRIDIDSSTVFTGNNRWKIEQSSVLVDSGSIAVNNIHVSSNEKFYHADGAISHDLSDTLKLQFKGIDISPLNYLGKNKDPNDSTRLRMNLRGQLNGDISLTGVFDNFMLESDIVMNRFSMLGSEYGNIFINSEFDETRKVVDITARNDLGGIKMFDVEGYYDPDKKAFNIGFLANKLPVNGLNPLLRSFASGISGLATGRLRLAGTKDNLTLIGAIKTDNVRIRINYLQTFYTLNDSIRFDSKGIRFNNVRFSDEEGRLATINGGVNHTNFRNYSADLTINMGNNFLAMNTQYKDNPSFYGKVYASGVTRIKTTPELLSFDISARTGNNTKFFIPLSDELSVAEYSFINFINPEEQKGPAEIKVQTQPKKLGINLNMDLTVTPDAVAELIFDEKVGDKITGSGSGILNISMNPKGIFQITGDYTIEKGTYLFTLGNVIAKRFDVENGGRILFNGDLDDAEIELKAIYQKFSASLFPLTQDTRDLDSRYAVEPQILLSGKLFNPTVKFEINLPNANEEARTSLRNSIASDESLNRQFMYLLVTNTFYSEQALASSGYSNAGTSAMAATTFEMISNQLSNWISQINDNFNLGLNYRPGSGDRYDRDEVQVAFETQVLDNRIILNGNFDYRTSSSEGTEQLTGDFEAEVKITDKLRFKVFNRFNDTYFGSRGPYTQGVGIFYREDFQKITDLFKRKEKQAAIREEEITLRDNINEGQSQSNP